MEHIIWLRGRMCGQEVITKQQLAPTPQPSAKSALSKYSLTDLHDTSSLKVRLKTDVILVLRRNEYGK
jgi:hypothetical protein